MGFYQLNYLDQGASQDSSPEASPLTTPYGSLEKIKPTKEQESSYMFPLPPSIDDNTSEPGLLHLKQERFSGLGLDGLVAEAKVTATPQHPAGEVAFAPDNFYDSDGLTGSQGWSPSTCAPSRCPSPLEHDQSFRGHSRTASFTRPLSIRKSSGKQGSIIVHDNPEDDDMRQSYHHTDDDTKLARLQSSLALLGLSQGQDFPDSHSDADHASDAASESSPKSSPVRLDARMFYSPEHGAPSLAEQLAFACGNGYGYEVPQGVSHHDSALDYLPPWLKQRLEQGRRDSMESSSSLGLNPLSGLRAETGDSWTEAHGHGGGDLSRSGSRSTRASIYASTASGSPILTGPLSATSHYVRPTGGSFDSNSTSAFTADTAASIHRQANLANDAIKQVDVEHLFHHSLTRQSQAGSEESFPTRGISTAQPRLSLSPYMSSLQEFSYLTLFGGEGEADTEASVAKPSSQAQMQALFSPPLSTPELERDCQGDLSFGCVDGLPSPVLARPSSIGMRPFALTDSMSMPSRGLVASKSMFDLHSRSLFNDEDDETQDETVISQPAAVAPPPAMTTSQSTSSVLNRGRPVRQGDYLQRRPDVITVTRNKASLSSNPDGPARPTRLPPPVPKRSSSMGRLSAAAAIQQSYMDKSKAEESAAKAEAKDSRSPPVQLIPGHRDSGTKSTLAIDKGMLFSPQTPKMPAAGVPAQRPAAVSFVSSSRSAIDLHAEVRPRTLSREASEAMKMAKLESTAGSQKMTKSSSSTSSRPFFSTSIFKRSNASSVSLPKASKSVVDLRESVGPLDAEVTAPIEEIKSSKKSAKSKKIQKAESKSLLGRPRTKSQSAPSPPEVAVPPAAPVRSHSEPAEALLATAAQSKKVPQQWEVRRPSVNNHGFIRSPAQDSAIFPASHSMPVLFVARTQSQRRRGETGIPETTPSPLLPSDFRSGNGRRARATRWGSAKAMIDERGIREEEETQSERSALPTPSGCVLVVEEHKVSEEVLDLD